MKYRVLYVVGQLSIGGSETQLCALLAHMNLEYCWPAVVVWNYREGETHVSHIRAMDVPLYGLTAYGCGLPQRARKLWRLCQALALSSGPLAQPIAWDAATAGASSAR
jgi:hypothetical protein